MNMIDLEFTDNERLFIRLVMAVLVATLFVFIMPTFWEWVGETCCNLSAYLNAEDFCHYIKH